MERDAQLTQLDDLIAALEHAQAEVGTDISTGLRLGGDLREACRTLGDASTGSWVGWHARMYYADYVEPPVGDTWNTEWGGVHGYSANWEERTLREVQDEVERRAGGTMSAAATTADRIRETCEPLQREVLTIVSPICDLGGLDNEAQLLRKIEEVDWIVSPAKFIEAIRPTQIWSRDSGAISHGMQVPLHLNVEAGIVSNTSTIATCRRLPQRCDSPCPTSANEARRDEVNRRARRW